MYEIPAKVKVKGPWLEITYAESAGPLVLSLGAHPLNPGPWDYGGYNLVLSPGKGTYAIPYAGPELIHFLTWVPANAAQTIAEDRGSLDAKPAKGEDLYVPQRVVITDDSDPFREKSLLANVYWPPI